MASERVTRGGRTPLLLLGAVMAAVAGYLVFLVGQEHSLWLDETLSAGLQDLSWRGLWTVLTERDTNMALYLVLLKAWSRSSTDPAALRALSVLFGVATIPLVYVLGTRLRDRVTGVIAAAVMGANAFFLVHSQEVRGYTLVLFLVSLASLLFFRACEDPRLPRFVWYVLVAAAGVYVSWYALFVVAAHGVASLLHRDRRVLSRYTAAATAAVLVLIAPLIAFVATAGVEQMSWDEVPSIVELARAVANVLGGQGLTAGAPLLVLFALGGAAALRSAVSLGWDRGGWAPFALAAWALAPILGGFLLSQATPIFEERYLIVALPPLCLLLALGLRSLPVPAAYGGLALVLVVLLSQAVQPVLPRNDERWDEASAYVLEEAVSGDGIAFAAASTRLAFGYHARDAAGRAFPAPLAPYYSWSWPEARDALAAGSGPVFAAVSPDLDPGDLGPYERVWLVLSHEEGDPRGTEALTELLEGSLEAVEERSFGSIDVRLYASR
jgi:mannosyltransferase